MNNLLRDYGAVCLAICAALSAWAVISEWLSETLYHEHVACCRETMTQRYDEVTRLFW